LTVRLSDYVYRLIQGNIEAYGYFDLVAAEIRYRLSGAPQCKEI